MTTTSIPLSALPPVTDNWRRDQYKRYLIRPPGASKPVGYTRATTVAKALDSAHGLIPWKATLAICGTLMRRGLRARWEALIAEHGGDPWYAGDEAKAACKQLVKECATAGGADDSREVGTALHAISALIDLGRQPQHLSDETDRDLRAYLQGLAMAGVELIPNQVELTGVLDEFQVAGTFDRLAMVPGFELPLIADLKTGANLAHSWHYIATQLAIYSRFPETYRQGPAEDGSEDVRTPMPAVDQDNGLVMHLDAGTGQLELHLVDLRSGWESFLLSMAVRQWLKADVARPLEAGGFVHAPEDLGAALEASVRSFSPGGTRALAAGGLSAAPAKPDQIDGGAGGLPGRADPAPPSPIEGGAGDPPGGGHPPASPSLPEPSFTAQLRAWLQERIDAVGAHPQARVDLARSWPSATPPLRSSPDHSAEDLLAIEQVLDAVEGRHQLPFEAPRPEPEDDVALVLHLFPNSIITKGITP